jgi:hypothetical protein
MTDSPSADFDSPWKEALAHYLPHALRLFLPAVASEIAWDRGYSLLDKELQQVTRDADLGRRLADTLVQVWRRDGTEAWVLIHIEVQGQPERDFARRMYVYHYRISDRYERPIMSVAVLADEQADWRPDRFTQELWGCTIEMRYPVVKLLDWRERETELAASTNPFAVVVQAHLAAQATREAVEARAQAKLRLIRSLYARGYERAQVLELLRLIDWLLALPLEQERIVEQELEKIEEDERMAYVTSWERIGQDRGRVEGLLEGLLEGLAVALDLRFGEAGVALLPELRQITDPEVLQQVAARIKTAASVEDLRQVYQTTSDPG